MLSLLTIFTKSPALQDTAAAMTTPEKVVGEDIYVVMTVTLIVFGGVLFYLFHLGNKLNSLKKRIDSQS